MSYTFPVWKRIGYGSGQCLSSISGRYSITSSRLTNRVSLVLVLVITYLGMLSSSFLMVVVACLRSLASLVVISVMRRRFSAGLVVRMLCSFMFQVCPLWVLMVVFIYSFACAG